MNTFIAVFRVVGLIVWFTGVALFIVRFFPKPPEAK